MANEILEVLAGNAIAASVVFLLAVGITCCTRNSALRNLAWTLVLLKLVTPGIVAIPVPSLPLCPAIAPAANVRLDPAPRLRSHEANAAPVTDISPAEVAPQKPAVAAPGFAGWSPAVVALCAWLSGSVVIVLLSCMRIFRLRGLVSRAASVSHHVSCEVSWVQALAKLESEPRVLVIDARFTPFILPFGWKPALVLPQPLLRTLDKDERATVIAHELAHLRRRDHWIAWIELAAIALYWWLPVAWLARNFARRSSENCCDGWVLRWLPDSALTYAGALLKVVDFIAPRRIAPLDFTPATGRFSLTKWRLAMILENKCRPQMPGAARLVAWPLCAAMLACTPALVRKVQSDDGTAHPSAYERAAADAPKTIALAAVQADGLPRKVWPRPHKLTVRVADSNNKPISGADVGTSAYSGRAASPMPPQAQWAYAGGISYLDHFISDLDGIAHIENKYRDLGNSRGHISVVARYSGRHLMGLADVDPAHLTEPVELTLVPECEVSGKIVCPELAKLGRKLGWVGVSVSMGITSYGMIDCPPTEDGRFHFFVPPGRYKLFINGTYLAGKWPWITVSGGKSAMNLSLTVAAAKWALLLGRPAPELRDIVAWKNSDPLKLADLRGKCVLLYFWHGLFLEDMPALFQLDDRFSKDGLVVIGIHIDDPSIAKIDPSLAHIDSAVELDARLAPFKWMLGGREIPFPIAFGVGEKPAVEQDYGPNTYSMGILIDRRGNVVDRVLLGTENARSKLQKCLNEKPASDAPASGRR